MKKLLVITFLIKLLALKNIFDFICGKYGQATLKLARETERTRLKIRKLKADIKFLLVCKRNGLIPKFARPKFAVKMDRKTKKRTNDSGHGIAEQSRKTQTIEKK